MPDPARYRASPDCEAAPFGDGIALLDLRSNRYFSLNATGRFVFEALAEPRSAEAVAALLADAYDVAPEACRADVDALIASLAASRLVDPA